MLTMGTKTLAKEKGQLSFVSTKRNEQINLKSHSYHSFSLLYVLLFSLFFSNANPIQSRIQILNANQNENPNENPHQNQNKNQSLNLNLNLNLNPNPNPNQNENKNKN